MLLLLNSMNIKTAVLAKNNDYSSLENTITSFNLLKDNFTFSPKELNESFSIIMPSYNVASSLPKVIY